MRRPGLCALAALVVGLSARSPLLAQNAPEAATMATFDWGWQKPGLLRYNRVEGLSLGARAAVRFGVAGAPLAAALTARLGSADRDLRGMLSLERETTVLAISLSAYRELQMVEPSALGLELANSATALVFGRDDGDYFQASGVALTWTPPSAHRAWYRVRVFAERQEPVGTRTRFSLVHLWSRDHEFRSPALAARAKQVGFEASVSPWWVTDPTRPAVDWQVALHGERGDFDFVRALVKLRAIVPLPADARLDLAAGGGTTHGLAPTQRFWIVGGPASLRGFDPARGLGPEFLSGRVELTRRLRELRGFRAMDLRLFTDGGWAGDRSQLHWSNALASAGVGVSILDGVLKLDAAQSWRGPDSRRVDIYFGRRP